MPENCGLCGLRVLLPLHTPSHQYRDGREVPFCSELCHDEFKEALKRADNRRAWAEAADPW